MKKLLLLFAILVSFVINVNAQNPTPFYRLKITNNLKDNTATRILVQDSITKEVKWILKSGLSLTETDPTAVHLVGEQTIGAGEKTFEDNVNFSNITVSGAAYGVESANPNAFVINSQLDGLGLTTPTLQEVTTEGNTSTNPIIINTPANQIGIKVNSLGTAIAVQATSDDSFGVSGNSTNSRGVVGFSQNSYGISGTSNAGSAGVFGISNAGNPIVVFQKYGTDMASINHNGNITGNSFIKSGGTSSQFLKADGSVDSNTYATTSSIALKPLDEGNGIGFAYGADRTLFGNIGLDAFDFSYSDTVSSTLGATGENSFNTGINNTSSGYSSSTFGFANETSALGGFTTGFNNKNAGYTNLVTGTGHDVTGMSMTVVGQASNVINQSVATFNEATSPVFVVGNGVIADANPDYTITSRSDALIVRKNGVIEAPSMTVAEIEAGTANTLTTKEYVLEKLSATSTELASSQQKSNIPEIALNRYRSISNNSPRKIAWIGDSVTMHTGFYMIDSRDSSTRTLDTPETFVITDISAAGVCTSSTAHNLLVNSVIYSTTTANGFVNNSYYYVSQVISATEFKIVSNAFAAVILTAGTGLTITISFSSFYDNKVARYVGAPMYKVTNGAFGANGNTANNFLASIGNPAINLGFEQVVSFAPDLIVYSYGINDVRLGTTTQAQLEAIISSTVEAFKLRLPNADIILRMPNHLCYDAGSINTYLGAGTTYAQAQDRSDRLRLAYRAMIAKYANVYVLDTQGGEGAIFSEKVPSATNIYMSDCLHPNIVDGQGAIFREVLLSIGNFGKTRVPLNSEPSKFYPQISTVVSANATSQSANDYLIFPRVVEDPTKYNLLFKGKRAASAKGSYWDVGKYKIGVAEAKNYTNVIKPNDIAVVYGTLEYTAGSQGEYFDNGVAAFKLTTANVATQGNNFRITSLPAGYPMSNGVNQEVAFYRAKPITQLKPANNDFNEVVSFVDFTAQTTHKIIEQFSVCSVITGISNTAPTTGGAITLNKNGVAFATLTWADTATTATGSGAFFTDGTRGIVFDEGDVLSVIVNSGFVGGTIPKIRLSNK